MTALLPSGLFSDLATRRNRVAICCLDRVRTCAAGVGRACLDLAGGRARSAAVLVRSRPPVRGWPASWRGSRRTGWHAGAGAGRGCRVLRGHGSDGRQNGFDPDSVRLHRDARAPRLHRGEAWRARGRGFGRRRRRAERSGGCHRALRVLRRAGDGRRAGVRGSTPLPDAASHGCAVGHARADH
jgi:hypothetical protein